MNEAALRQHCQQVGLVCHSCNCSLALVAPIRDVRR
jgi:hypothetical protein